MKKLKQRTSEHTSVIYWLERSFPLAAHFNDIKHDIMSLRLFSIEPSPAPSREGDHNLLLNRSEASWMSAHHGVDEREFLAQIQTNF